MQKLELFGAGVTWRHLVHLARTDTGSWEQSLMRRSSRELARVLRETDTGVQLVRFRGEQGLHWAQG